MSGIVGHGRRPKGSGTITRVRDRWRALGPRLHGEREAIVGQFSTYRAAEKALHEFMTKDKGAPMAKRLTPERFEILRPHMALEVLQHIEALEAAVDDAAGGLLRAGARIVALQDELSAATATIARLKERDDPANHDRLT